MTPSARPKVLALDNLKRFRSMDEECAKSEFAIIDDSRIEFIQPPEREGEYDVETWVREAIKDVSAVITNRWGYALSPEALDAAKKLKLIVVPSAGYDQINTSDIKRRGIRLANTPNGLVEATAETAFILALWTMRDMKALERIVSKGSWARDPHPGWNGMLGQGLKDKTIGILGMGNIGQSLVPLMSPWGVKRFLYTTSRPGQPARQDVYGHLKRATVPVEPAKDFETLAREADLLFVCCQLNESTKHIINAGVLDKMKRTAVVINVGRGGLVDSRALLDALKQEKIYGAGLDVLENEWTPKVLDHQELVDHPRCVCLPHVGSAIGRSRVESIGVALRNAVHGALDEPFSNEIQL